MRVLHCYKTSLRSSMGGVEMFMHTLSNSVANLGIESTIFSLSKNPSPEPILIDQHQVVECKEHLHLASTGFSASAFKKFRELVQETDIIHYHFPYPFADILHFACRVSKPTVLTYHSDIIKQKWLIQLYKPLMHQFLSAMDVIVATSPNYFATSDVLRKHLDNVETIPVGMDLSALPQLNPERVDYWKKKLPQRFFLFIGAMRYYKGLHVAIDAIANTPFQLVLAGIGGVEAALKKRAKALNLDNIHFLGAISEEDKVALHHLSYAFVFPSHMRSEAFGLSLVEAAAMQKPMISCEIGTGTSFVNIHEETGLVIKPSSPHLLREAMQYLLEHPDKAKALGINAKKRYQSLFTAEKQAQSYASLYHKLL